MESPIRNIEMCMFAWQTAIRNMERCIFASQTAIRNIEVCIFASQTAIRNIEMCICASQNAIHNSSPKLPRYEVGRNIIENTKLFTLRAIPPARAKTADQESFVVGRDTSSSAIRPHTSILPKEKCEFVISSPPPPSPSLPAAHRKFLYLFSIQSFLHVA